MALRQVPLGLLVSGRWEVAACKGSWGRGGRACVLVEAIALACPSVVWPAATATGRPCSMGKWFRTPPPFLDFGPAKLTSSSHGACHGGQGMVSQRGGFPPTSVSLRLIPILRFIKEKNSSIKSLLWLKLLGTERNGAEGPEVQAGPASH